MSEESTTPDLVELTREVYRVASQQDLDGLMSFFAPHAVWDLSNPGIGVFEGVAAIAEFFKDWWATWEDHHHEVQEIHDLGGGVVFAVVREDGQLLGSDSYVEQQGGWVSLWVAGLIERVTGYLDIDEGRAAAGRVAETRR
jgi:ketosteroid isomerase-like protein